MIDGEVNVVCLEKKISECTNAEGNRYESNRQQRKRVDEYICSYNYQLPLASPFVTMERVTCRSKKYVTSDNHLTKCLSK